MKSPKLPISSQSMAIYRAIEPLLERGLVLPTDLGMRPIFYRPAPPDRAEREYIRHARIEFTQWLEPLFEANKSQNKQQY